MGAGLLMWKGWLAAVLLALPQTAPQEHLYGRVETVRGEVHVGFIRWGLRGGAWADLLEGAKALPEENLRQARRLRAEADPEADLAARTIVYGGVRITWDEDDTEATTDSVQSGVRFGHVRSITPGGGRSAHVVLREGGAVELFAQGGRDEAFASRIVVEPASGARIEIAWGDLARVEFMEAPAGEMPRQARLHGTVRDRSGNRYTGYLAWGDGRLYTGDLLADGPGVALPFERVQSVVPGEGSSARVTLASGETTSVGRVFGIGATGRNVHVSDPELGGVRLPWRRIEEVRLHPPADRGGRREFEAARLRGVVLTRSGERHQGLLRWDNDEEHGWEILNGSDRGAAFTIELAKVRSIVQETPRSVEVTLTDGRTLSLSGSNDVGLGNEGIVIELDDGTFRFVDWLQFERAELERP
jgi:hypothetical protein